MNVALPNAHSLGTRLSEVYEESRSYHNAHTIRLEHRCYAHRDYLCVVDYQGLARAALLTF